MTPLEWEVRLHRERKWGEAYPHVEREARAYLSSLAEGVVISTNDLVEALYPVAAVRGEGQARDRIYSALRATVQGKPALLVDCRTRGTAMKKMRGGIKVRPWFWHRPKLKMVCCPNCLTEFAL